MTQKQLEQGIFLDRKIHVYKQAFNKISEDCTGTFDPEVKAFLQQQLALTIEELAKQFEQI